MSGDEALYEVITTERVQREVILVERGGAIEGDGGGGTPADFTFSQADVLLGRSTSGGGAGEEIPCTSLARSLLAAINATAARTVLELGTMAVQSADAVAITAGAINGLSSLGVSGALTISDDVILVRDAANTLALRNSSNAQTLLAYNTYTDASNYERAYVRWASNVLEIGSEGAGTGISRNLILRGGTNSATQGAITLSTGAVKIGYSLQLSDTGTGLSRAMFYTPADSVVRISNSTGTDFNRLQFGGLTSSYPALKRVGNALAARLADDSAYGPFLMKRLNLAELEATSPAAPAVGATLYVEDDGAGKTRIMALFPTGAAQQVAIEP